MVAACPDTSFALNLMDMKYIKNVYTLPDTGGISYPYPFLQEQAEAPHAKRETPLKVTKWRTETHWMSLASLFFTSSRYYIYTLFFKSIGDYFRGIAFHFYLVSHIYFWAPGSGLSLGWPPLKALWAVCLRIAAQMIYKLDKGQKLRQKLSPIPIP